MMTQADQFGAIRPVSFGLLGASQIANDSLAPAMLATKTCVPVAIAARRLERAELFGDRFGIATRYDDYEQVLADRRVDSVYISLPNSAHAAWTLRALQAGKHVLCEKPLALTPAEAESIDEAARLSGKVAMEATMWPFHPQVDRLRALVAEGAIGTLVELRARFGFQLDAAADIRFDATLGGGALYDLGPYVLGAALMFGNGSAEVISIRARWTAPPHDPSAVDQRFEAELLLGNGCRASIACAFDSEAAQDLTLVGTRGSLRLTQPWLPGVDAGDRPEDCDAPLFLNGRRIATDRANPYQSMLESFAKAADAGPSGLRQRRPVASRVKLSSDLLTMARTA
jgi:xylose dehydrogenase (NAD/NADP)